MAGRIPQSFIDDLLNRTDIADVVEERVSLKRTGRNYSALCPFHKEKSPSFSVNPEKQFYYCFGCGAAGNAIGFVMEYDRIDFPQAVEQLSRRLGIEVPQEASIHHHEKTERLKENYSILDKSADYYEQQLRNHADRAKAVEYLKQRGLSGQIAKRYQIGFAPAGWDNLINYLNKAMPEKPTEEQLDEAGMVIYRPEDKKCYDRFRDRIMFPIVDMRGRVIAFGGRVLTDEKPKYLNSPETPTFHKNQELYGLYQARQANRKLDRVVIVEGYMDVVALAQFDINNAVATLGTATSEHHLTRLFKIVPEVIFCFDGDAAGRKAAHRALETALPVMEDGREARFLFLPEGEDPDSLVRQEGKDAFQQRLNQATPLSSFFFDAHSEGLNTETSEGASRLSKTVLPLLDSIPGNVFRELMRQKLAAITGLSPEFMAQLAASSAEQTSKRANQPSNDASNQQLNSEPNASSNTALDKQSANTNYPNNSHEAHETNNYYEAMPDYGDMPDYSDGSHFTNEPNSHHASAPTTFAPKPAARHRFNISTLGQRIIRTLLHFPQLTLKVDLETTDTLGQLNDPELLLLKKLIERIRQQPDIATIHLLVEWQGEPEFDILKDLAEQEVLVIDTEALANELLDGLVQLVKKQEQIQCDELRLKIRNKTPLSNEERTLFTRLLSKR